MTSQFSSGVLYIVATPIGNMDDITLRAVKTLKQVDLAAAEDTRKTARLLAHHGIGSPLVSCHEHNEADRIPLLLKHLENGDSIALVSDAGTPSVSDPGFRLVRAAVEAGVRVVPIPGPSAAVSALSASGLPTDAFTFAGFLPKKKGRRKEMLTSLAHHPFTLIFYESPRRILNLLEEMQKIFGDREAVLGREITKLHEEFIRGRLSDIRKSLSSRPEVKGECTLLVAGETHSPEVSMEVIREAIQTEMANGAMPLSALSKTLAKKFGVSKNSIYAEALEIKERINKNGYNG